MKKNFIMIDISKIIGVIGAVLIFLSDFNAGSILFVVGSGISISALFLYIPSKVSLETEGSKRFEIRYEHLKKSLYNSLNQFANRVVITCYYENLFNKIKKENFKVSTAFDVLIEYIIDLVNCPAKVVDSVLILDNSKFNKSTHPKIFELFDEFKKLFESYSIKAQELKNNAEKLVDQEIFTIEEINKIYYINKYIVEKGWQAGGLPEILREIKKLCFDFVLFKHIMEDTYSKYVIEMDMKENPNNYDYALINGIPYFIPNITEQRLKEEEKYGK